MADNWVKRVRAADKAKRAIDRPTRIQKISKKLTERHARQVDKGIVRERKKPLLKKEPKKVVEVPIIAYDFETTKIKKGTPDPLYITAYGDDFFVSQDIKSLEHLRDILINKFLLVELNKTRFVGWNANNFDVYFIAAALLHEPEYLLRPYLTKGKSLRGLKVILKEKVGGKIISWEFLDGMSMTGIQKPLKDFLKTFAPDYQKLDGPSFETEDFNSKIESHVKYAERDSEGLYYGILNAQNIVKEKFGEVLRPTIGNMGIRIFQANMPSNAIVWQPNRECLEIVKDYVMRGGYCHCVRKYEGPIWKYDINQAYAAAMREAHLPQGRAIKIFAKSKYAQAAIYRIKATHKTNIIPFYYRDIETGASRFENREITDTWITSIEYDQLIAEGWQIEISEGWMWDSVFNMKDYVDKLEDLRVNAPGGPKSAQGEMVKAIGNNSYGKTVETLDGLEIVLSAERPDGYFQYQSEDELLQHIWCKLGKPMVKEYHQPQLGAFITAHVRMVLRRAALTHPTGWLYGDTDCVIFDSPPPGLPTDPKKYGMWKIESEGEEFRLITKKVYANFGATEKHSKGINVKRLTDQDFIDWYNGKPPIQVQTQRNNFLKVMTGADMYLERKKVGQKIPLQSVA